MGQVFTERQQFWIDHLRCLESEGISIRAYAQREGFGEGSLYAARRLLARTPGKRLPPAKPFAAVQVMPSPAGVTVMLPGAVSLRLSELPSAAWLAELVRGLAR